MNKSGPGPADDSQADRTAPEVAAARAPKTRTLRCRTVASGGFRQLNYVRNLPPIHVEERLELPEGEADVTPSEALLAALGSCLTARIRANAVASGTPISSLSLDVEADLNLSPMWSAAEGDPGQVGFAAIRVRVNLRADAPAEQLRAMIQHALIWSPVADTIHDAVSVDVALADAPPNEAGEAGMGEAGMGEA